MSSTRRETRQYSAIFGFNGKDSQSRQLWGGKLPTNAVIEDNPDVKKITGIDAMGRETIINSFVAAYKPTLTLTYGGGDLNLIALSRGRRVARDIFDGLLLPKKMQVTKNIYPGAPAGKIGFGIAVDAETRAVTIDDNLDTVPLVQQSFAAFDPATPNSFAIGANFARKFSNNLVADESFVTLQTPMPPGISARTVSEESLPPQAIEILVKSTDDTVTLIKIPNAILDPSGSKFDPKAESMDIKFDLSGVGVCEPYSIYELTSKVYCDR